jgi:hypothetical protein
MGAKFKWGCQMDFDTERRQNARSGNERR